MTKGNEAAGLRAVPPRDFVRARNALAAKLERDGKAAEAREVRRRRRPSPVVWALNNSAATPHEVAALADAVSRLRQTQLGQGALRPAMERLRAAIAPIIRSAAEQLTRVGLRVSPQLERRLHDTLVASGADRRLRAALLAGELTEERGAAGFDMLTLGSTPAVSRRARAPVRSPNASAPAERRRQRRAEREARQAARRAERAAREVARRAQREATAL
ncbi:MAG TPA: hypothetical protein VJU81_09400, partial [Methylomirabilota bacterium]|nr:hypothetical protein [Methylomirabilota bacterium]